LDEIRRRKAKKKNRAKTPSLWQAIENDSQKSLYGEKAFLGRKILSPSVWPEIPLLRPAVAEFSRA
jgi:hypothetical protein